MKSDLHKELESGELRKLIGDQEDQIRELKEMVHEARRDMAQTTSDAGNMARDGLEQLRKTVDDTANDKPASTDTTANPTNDNSVVANERISKS